MVKIDDLTSLTFDQPPRPVLAHVQEGNSRKALVSFRGNDQRHFYQVVKYKAGKMPLACFRSMDDAITFAECD
jgi:hypothetical protein